MEDSTVPLPFWSFLNWGKINPPPIFLFWQSKFCLFCPKITTIVRFQAAHGPTYFLALPTVIIFSPLRNWQFSLSEFHSNIFLCSKWLGMKHRNSCSKLRIYCTLTIDVLARLLYPSPHPNHPMCICFTVPFPIFSKYLLEPWGPCSTGLLLKPLAHWSCFDHH